MTNRQLGDRVGATKQSIHMLLDEGRPVPIHNSRLWPAIVSALGGEPPTHQATEIDDNRRAVLENWNKLTPEQQAVVASLVRTLTK